MLIFIDERSPEPSKKKLSQFGKVVGFITENITYQAISGHPDIFMFQDKDCLIVAPNIPIYYKEILKEYNKKFLEGQKSIGISYPESARYNAVSTHNLLIHNLEITDVVILKHLANHKKIHINQGYSRCNLIALNAENFISSDVGIQNALIRNGLNCHFVCPDTISLPGYPHGFFGGCFGIYRDNFFLNGNLKFLPENKKIREFIEAQNIKIIELHDGPLFDGGGVFFIE